MYRTKQEKKKTFSSRTETSRCAKEGFVKKDVEYAVLQNVSCLHSRHVLLTSGFHIHYVFREQLPKWVTCIRELFTKHISKSNPIPDNPKHSTIFASFAIQYHPSNR